MRLLTLDEAAAALSEGLPVVLPTDTVFGVGVSVAAAESPRALFKVKGRPANKPVAWLVESPETLDVYGIDAPDYAHALARAFWPGALTLVVRASESVPPAFRSEEGTIGLRMPASNEAQALIVAVGAPLAVTSANLSGAPAASSASQIDSALADATAGVFAPASGQSPSSSADSPALPSTVVDCTGEEPRILREGVLPWMVLKGALS